MRVVATADLHGHLPEIPDCDVLVLAGDYVNGGPDELIQWGAFIRWLWSIEKRGIEIVGIRGNADERLRGEAGFHLPWYFLENKGIEIKGVTFWGRPWGSKQQPPLDVDVVVCHAPPARDKVKNSLVLYGHIHFGGPRKTVDGSTFANVSMRQGNKLIKPLVFNHNPEEGSWQ